MTNRTKLDMAEHAAHWMRLGAIMEDCMEGRVDEDKLKDVLTRTHEEYKARAAEPAAEKPAKKPPVSRDAAPEHTEATDGRVTFAGREYRVAERGETVEVVPRRAQPVYDLSTKTAYKSIMSMARDTSDGTGRGAKGVSLEIRKALDEGGSAYGHEPRWLIDIDG